MAKRSVSQNGMNGASGEPHLTPIEEWKRLQLGTITELTSTGRVVKWRPVELLRMFAAGKIPDHLTVFVSQRVWLGTAADERTEQQKAADWLAYLDFMASVVLIHPRVIYGAQVEGDIQPTDLTYEELLEIEAMARNPIDKVRPFRGEQERDVGAVPQGNEVQQSA